MRSRFSFACCPSSCSSYKCKLVTIMYWTMFNNIINAHAATSSFSLCASSITNTGRVPVCVHVSRVYACTLPSFRKFLFFFFFFFFILFFVCNYDTSTTTTILYVSFSLYSPTLPLRSVLVEEMWISLKEMKNRRGRSRERKSRWIS